MATPIRIKRSAVSGKKPQNIDLQVGELALNTYDGSLFTKRDTGGVGIATTVSNITPWVENYGSTSINYSGGNVGINSNIPSSLLDVRGVVTATTFSGSGANLSSIPNSALDNSSVNYGGVSLALGTSDTTPAFNLSDATNYPYTSLTGIVTHIVGDTTPQLGGDLDGNSKSIHSVGILTATSFSGSGTNLTALNASNLGSGTVPDARFPATLPAKSGVNLTSLNATNLGSGTIPDSRFPSTLPAIDGSNLFGITADGLSGSPNINVSNIVGTALSVSGIATVTDTLKVGTAITAHAGVITATTFDGSLATTNLSGSITNAQLAGSIENGKLVNDSVSYGGVSVDLGASDATPAFDLADATNYPYTSLTGIVTHIVGDTTPQLGGYLDLNSKGIYGVGVITATDFNSTSDIKLKINIQPIDDPLAKVVQIEGVSFNWKHDNKPALGVVADQIENILPELVQGDDPKTVNYNGLIGLLIEAVKEQQTHIDNLEERISKLE